MVGPSGRAQVGHVRDGGGFPEVKKSGKAGERKPVPSCRSATARGENASQCRTASTLPTF
jgi:hypothetical protein